VTIHVVIIEFFFFELFYLGRPANSRFLGREIRPV
jgi:hypothetical protein